MAFPHYEIEFARDGRLCNEEQADTILRQAHNFSDLFVLCHGWSSTAEEARKLYGKLCDNMSTVVGLNLVPRLRGRKIAAIRVFWPCRRFAADEMLPGGGAAAAGAESDVALALLLEQLKHDPITLGGKGVDPVRVAALEHAQAMLPLLDTTTSARREFVFALRTILNPAFAHPDDATEELFARDPEELFSLLGVPVTFTTSAEETAAGAAAGQARSFELNDLQSGAKTAARRLASYAAYCEQKERACIVGATGLDTVLRRVRDANDVLRLHLVGHSFGAQLVIAAASLQPPKNSLITLALLQAACSHNALAQRFDDQQDGAFRRVLTERRVSGPILVTCTKHDAAVGIAYPLAACIARKPAAAYGSQGDPYAGMGRNGALHTPEAVNGALQDVGQAYRFASGKVYNLDADRFIRNHSDVAGPELAYAILNAACAI